MLYISCKKGDLYGVMDTDDGVVEMYSVDEIINFKKSGLDIRGISLDKGKVIIYCKSDNILNDFIKSIKSTLAMLSLFGVSEREAKIRKIQDLAVSYGIVLVPTQLSIDIDRHKLFIKSSAFNTFVDYETGGTIKKLDVCDKNVASLSRLGIEAFSNITLKVGQDLTITMNDLIKEVFEVVNFFEWDYHTDFKDVQYIGITPSNRMFKILVDYTLYSVRLDLLEKVISNADKILNTKVEKMYGFEDYIKTEIRKRNKSFLVSKFSKKSYKATTVNGLINKLKDKYPTLHDVYVRY